MQTFQNNTCIFCKPKAKVANFFYKDSKIQTLLIFFSTEWLEQNIQDNSSIFHNSIKYFIDSDRESMYISHALFNYKIINEEIASIFSKEKGSANKNKLELKIKTLTLLRYFIFEISSKEQDKVTPYIEVLLQYVYQPFPGIMHLSKEIGTSPSKLKTDFKKETGKSLFQYFREKQMILAKKILIDDSLLIKNIALTFGYENVSKFSTAFKNHHGYLPSERNC